MKIPDTPIFSSPLRRITVDLDPLTDVGRESEGCEELGLPRDYRDRVWDAVERWYRTGTQPFVSLCVRKQGSMVIHRSLGHRHGTWSKNGMGADGEVGSIDTPITVFSASKALTALLIHGLAEEGVLNLDERVAHYLPAFAANGKASITISQVLSHQGGFPVMPKGLPPETIFDYERVVDILMASPLQRPPGRGTAYHAVSGGYILGALANTVTGKSLNQILRKRVCVPLGLPTLRYGAPLNGQSRVATNYNTGGVHRWPVSSLIERTLGADWNTVVELSNQPGFLSTTVPAGNAIGTASEWGLLMELLLNQGRIGDVQVFAPDTLRRVTQFKAGSILDGTLFVPSRFSEGLMLGANPVSLFGPMTKDALGHLGFINIFCWADPSRDLSVALLSTGKSLFGLHLAELMRVLFAINRAPRAR
ncbi:MAG: serine hydrolase domain-containing protein [Pseudomonadota bacterium]